MPSRPENQSRRQSMYMNPETTTFPVFKKWMRESRGEFLKRILPETVWAILACPFPSLQLRSIRNGFSYPCLFPAVLVGQHSAVTPVSLRNRGPRLLIRCCREPADVVLPLCCCHDQPV